MTTQEWDQFFELLDKIVDGEGTWEEKSGAVVEAAAERESEAKLEEFCGWFATEDAE